MANNPVRAFEPPRLKSGIPGFDAMSGGGIVRDSIVALGGDTGTGKSIFALQFLYKGMTESGENGLYISLSETKETVYKAALAFGWDLESLERQDRFVFVRYQPSDLLGIVDSGGNTLSEAISTFTIKRMVIDPLTAYQMLFESAPKEQQHISALFDILRLQKCTTMVVAEEPSRIESNYTDKSEYLSDGVIHFYAVHKNAARIRAIEIIKMRQTAIKDAVCPMKIDGSGMAVFPDQVIEF